MMICKNKFTLFILVLLFTAALSGCGFHLHRETVLAPPLKRMYLQAQDPYGPLSRYLEDYLRMSNVDVVPNKDLAKTILVIQNDTNAQSLLSVSGTQQTRQYNLIVNITYTLTDSHGTTIIPPQSISESRTLTIQSNQILGSSNEATLIYQQIRRSLAGAIINYLSSQAATDTINEFFAVKTPKKTLSLKKRKQS